MTDRKKKLLVIQISLLLVGVLIIFLTYSKNISLVQEKTISTKTKKMIEEQLKDTNNEGDVFKNIEYSNLDLAGNRYILKAEEAYNNKSKEELVIMKFVEAIFYFKDGTVLKVKSQNGIYNNKSLDMSFENDVEAIYEGSELFADKAEYSNSKSYLSISGRVQIKDLKGTMFADNLLFDIKKQKLNISALKDKKIETNINLK
tara:strand:- start:269 stop:874 length:606 start_codon:yes stop_codon:yes gene_type:complete